ncbi:hypothetical protein P3342_009199 [Pyrenophora teres f. teres]|nr:hypothetical protein P3342_009199 [Pyrenophora teres f. teres]
MQDVTTRGEYYPDKNMATATNPPLYLRITSTSKEGLDKAIEMIEEMMKEDLPNLVDERRFRRREPENFERDEFGRRKWPEEKISVNLEPINGFNLRAQVVGRGGDNVKYIQQETGCKVQIKGRGSGFMEPNSGQESDEPMYLHIAGPRPEGVAYAKQLCEELLEKVKTDYHAYKERPPPNRYGDRDGYSGGRPGYGDRGDRGDRERNNSYGYGGGGGGGEAVATAAARAAMVDRADTVVTTATLLRIHSCPRPLQPQLRMQTPKPMMRMPHRQRGLPTTPKTPKQTLMPRMVGTRRTCNSMPRTMLSQVMARRSHLLLLPVLVRRHLPLLRLQTAMVLLRHRLRQQHPLPITARSLPLPACKCQATAMISRLRQALNLT